MAWDGDPLLQIDGFGGVGTFINASKRLGIPLDPNSGVSDLNQNTKAIFAKNNPELKLYDRIQDTAEQLKAAGVKKIDLLTFASLCNSNSRMDRTTEGTNPNDISVQAVNWSTDFMRNAPPAEHLITEMVKPKSKAALDLYRDIMTKGWRDVHGSNADLHLIDGWGPGLGNNVGPTNQTHIFLTDKPFPRDVIDKLNDTYDDVTDYLEDGYMPLYPKMGRMLKGDNVKIDPEAIHKAITYKNDKGQVGHFIPQQLVIKEDPEGEYSGADFLALGPSEGHKTSVNSRIQPDKRYIARMPTADELDAYNLTNYQTLPKDLDWDNVKDLDSAIAILLDAGIIPPSADTTDYNKLKTSYATSRGDKNPASWAKRLAYQNLVSRHGSTHSIQQSIPLIINALGDRMNYDLYNWRDDEAAKHGGRRPSDSRLKHIIKNVRGPFE